MILESVAGGAMAWHPLPRPGRLPRADWGRIPRWVPPRHHKYMYFMLCFTVCVSRAFSVPSPPTAFRVIRVHYPCNPPLNRHLPWRCGKIPQDLVRFADHKLVN